MANGEQVLVVPRKVLEQVGIFQGLNFEVDRYLREFFEPGVISFMLREKAETDPGYKQLIPYVIMSYRGMFLNYVRGKRAGETRLVGNRSIGIGGHINPVDDTLFKTDLRDIYLTAVEREVSEEVDVQAKHSDRIVALLNDDSNEVGQVHLGIVHFWALGSEKVEKREQMITQMSFASAEELEKDKDSLETWSSLCLSHLDEMAEG